MSAEKYAVVTGATGMIGLALIRRLLAEGYSVFAVVRPHSERRGNIPDDSRITVVECELSEYSRLPQLVGRRCSLFFHLAWEGTYGSSRDDMSLQLKNIGAAADACNSAAALGCGVFVGAGSQAEYGRKSEKLSPDTKTNPETGYGIAKLCAGQMTRVLCGKAGIRHIWCRIFSVYGSYDAKHTMVMSGIIKMLDGERASYTAGEQLWDYIHCDDAAEAIYLSAVKGRDGAVYCIGSGEVRPLKEYILGIRDAVNPSLEVGIGEIPYFDKQVMYLCADTESLRRDTGFVPKIGFSEGIADVVSRYRKQVW